MIKVGSDVGATYIIGEIIAKDKIDIIAKDKIDIIEDKIDIIEIIAKDKIDITYKLSLGMCDQSLFKWWCHLHYW